MPKANELLLGWLRDVFDRNADSMQRLRPSAPTERSNVFNRSSVTLVEQNSAAAGWCRAIRLSVSSSVESCPVGVRGQSAMPCSYTHFSKSLLRKLVPSNKGYFVFRSAMIRREPPAIGLKGH